jgi:hypothetical protein
MSDNWPAFSPSLVVDSGDAQGLADFIKESAQKQLAYHEQQIKFHEQQLSVHQSKVNYFRDLIKQSDVKLSKPAPIIVQAPGNAGTPPNSTVNATSEDQRLTGAALRNAMASKLGTGTPIAGVKMATGGSATPNGEPRSNNFAALQANMAAKFGGGPPLKALSGAPPPANGAPTHETGDFNQQGQWNQGQAPVPVQGQVGQYPPFGGQQFPPPAQQTPHASFQPQTQFNNYTGDHYQQAPAPQPQQGQFNQFAPGSMAAGVALPGIGAPLTGAAARNFGAPQPAAPAPVSAVPGSQFPPNAIFLRAMYDYNDPDPTYLTFERGHIGLFLKKMNEADSDEAAAGTWWKVQLLSPAEKRDVRGYAPSNYFEKLDRQTAIALLAQSGFPV